MGDRVGSSWRLRLAGSAAAMAVVIGTSLLDPTGAAGQHLPGTGWSKHCVADQTDSYQGGGGSQGESYLVHDDLRATACEYKFGRSMQTGLTWQVLHIKNAPDRKAGVTGLSTFYFQVWDCTTGKLVKWGKKYYRKSRNYGTHGTTQTKTFFVNAKHSYRVRITGKVVYWNDGGLWHFQIYPPTNPGGPPIGALNRYSACYR